MVSQLEQNNFGKPKWTSSESKDRLGEGGGEARNMKSMQPPLAAIFFNDLFLQGGG